MFNGIKISETRLLTNNIIFTCMLLVTIGLGIWAYVTFYHATHPKTKQKIKKLKKQAQTNPLAQKQLQKLQRKEKRKSQTDLYVRILVWGVLALLIVLNLFLAIIPGWTDYIKKDYVVYEGEFVVERLTRKNYIILDDGSKLTGCLGLPDGNYVGQVVYSRRTKISLGRKTK